MSYRYSEDEPFSKPIKGKPIKSKPISEVGEAAIDYQAQNVKAHPTIANIDFEALNRPDLEKEFSQLREKYQQAKRELLERHKSQKQSEQVAKLLEMLGDFDDKPAMTRLELIRRYSVLRNKVREKVEFVNAKELANILDENKTNWTRDLANLYKKDKLLAIRRLGSSNWEYPLNQIDPVQGAVYPALEAIIGDFKAQGLSDWDILIWLNLPNVIEQDANPVLINEQESLDDILTDFDARKAPKPLPQVIPIELLQQGKIEIFNHQAKRFLNPEFGG